MKPIPIATKWSVTRKIIFRFVCCYFIAYMLPWEMLGSVFDSCISWIGKTVLHIPYPITVKPNGSGDTTYNYVEMFFQVSIAVIGGITWSIIGFKRASYNKLLYWLRVLVRYYLASMLLLYGYSKIFKSQFPAPSLWRLNEPYGESSPMGLAWTFFGYSTAFNVFMGFFEAIGGILLFFRRTVVLGACIATTVLANIVLINFCYDVPVKLLSSHLLLMCIFLLSGDAKRLLDFFIFNEVVEQADISKVFRKKGWKITRLVVKGLFLFATIGYAGYDCWDAASTYGDNAPKPRLYGSYKVMDFVLNNDTLQPLTTDTTRWHKLFLDKGNSVRIIKMNDSAKWYKCSINNTATVMLLSSYKDTMSQSRFVISRQDSSTITLRGNWDHDSLYVKLVHLDARKSLLTNRGFHWINEYPMNR